jgi:hypothetical protein
MERPLAAVFVANADHVPTKPNAVRTIWGHSLDLVCGLALTLPAITSAQAQETKLPRIGLLTWSSCDGPPSVPGLGEFEPFVRGLGDLGYKPGETVIFECRAAGGRYDGLETAAAELAQIPVDISAVRSRQGTRPVGPPTRYRS